MFSGKTEELIRRVRRALFAKQTVQAFKPSVDDRYAKEKIVSHQGIDIEAEPVASSYDLIRRVKPETDVVAIDEAQFFDNDMIDGINILADKGYRVIVAGLDQDFQGRPFHPVPELMAIAETVTKVRAVCSRCGKEASRTQRLVHGEEQVKVGGAESYEARCRGCHEP